MKRAALFLCAACASALHKPPPIESIAAAPRTGADQLIEEAEAAWAQRAEPGRAAAAEQLYLEAARAAPSRPEGFAGAIRAKAFRLGREKDSGERLRLAQGAVEVGQLCEEQAPAAPPCDYWLAAALGLQAREPGWPLGPGDPQAALPEAQAAVRIEPEFAPNQLTLGEALRSNGHADEARSAYSKALRLATEAASRGDPDAASWADEAKGALRDLAIGLQASSATVTKA